MLCLVDYHNTSTENRSFRVEEARLGAVVKDAIFMVTGCVEFIKNRFLNEAQTIYAALFSTCPCRKEWSLDMRLLQFSLDAVLRHEEKEEI